MLQLNPNQIPQEDFFTEIFAHLLKSDSYLLSSWLKEFDVSETNHKNVFVETQASFGLLDNHFSGSKPDIYIEVSEGNYKEIIFIECKINSGEGYQQLQRYAEHLDNLSSINRGILVYITKNYEKKESDYIFKKCSNGNKLFFFQLRWYQIYNFLKLFNKQAQNELVNETLEFMEESNLSVNNRFSSIDLLALTNFPRVKKMMDETMFGEVSEKFERIAGGISQKSSCMTHLKDYDTYVYYQSQTQNYEFGFYLGYWLKNLDMNDYPKVGFSIEVSPNANKRDEIIEAMKNIVEDSENWTGYGLNASKSWAGIEHLTTLDKFLHEDDHLETVRTHLLNILDEVDEFKIKYPHLPWKIPPIKK
ncbi:PD-(D/E)XK nuclease family protein [Methanosarcina sp. Mfa9]|uniref:PD-(D/E)XK nuclease family protein n=1 Tax=Methanosarcina sp. Mfa9 TaxID=3439063 RepID=UPI003F87DDD8